jgi:hypothetical protein
MKDDKHEGCGIWPFLLTNTRFYPACQWHDRAYEIRSWQQKDMTRKQVDEWFLVQMLFIAGNNLYHRSRAYLFYGIVRLLGGFFWEGE